MSERSYTVDEANAAIEEVRGQVERIRDARRTIVRSARRIKERAGMNGGGEEGTAHWQAIRILREEVESLGAKGIVLRDTESGLIDFPSRREGRLVYLCWRLGEDRVEHWHEVDSGFPGRKPL